MKIVLSISLSEEYDSILQTSLALSYDKEDEDICRIDVLTSPNFKYEDVVNKLSILDTIKYYSIEDELGISLDEEDKKINKYISDNVSQIISEAINPKEIEIYGSFGNIKKFFEVNSLLKDKKILIREPLPFNRDILEKLQLIFDKKNVLTRVEGNEDSISLDEFAKSLDIIDNIVNYINEFDYSPLEELIHVYDIVRDRLYIKEASYEKPTKSRDLTQSLLNNSIVCLGFANIFVTILEKLNIKAMVYIIDSTKDENHQHARALVFIDDPKYHIKGLYFFDPTFDCKKANDGNSFLNKYMYFGRTYEQIKCFDNGNFTYNMYPFFDTDNIYALENNFHLNGEVPFLPELLKYHVRRMHEIVYGGLNEYMSMFYQNSFDIEEIIERLLNIKELAEKPIPISTFLKALYVVRKNEYYSNPKKYIFDINCLIDILYNSKFIKLDSEENRLYFAIFNRGIIYSKNEISRIVKRKVKENNLDKEIAEIKLTRTLREIYNKRKEESK